MVIASPLCGRKPLVKKKIAFKNAEEFADAVSRFVPPTKVSYIDQ